MSDSRASPILSSDARSVSVEGYAGYVERTDPFTISGWAINREGTPQPVEVVANGNVLFTVYPTVARPDLRHTGQPDMPCGFFVDVTDRLLHSAELRESILANGSDGNVVLRVRLAGLEQYLPAGPVEWDRDELAAALEARLHPAVSPNLDRGATVGLYGCLEFANENGISGWLLDAAHPSNEVALDVVLSGEVACAASTGLFRKDISRILGSPVHCGFQIPWSRCIDVATLTRLPADAPCEIAVRVRGSRRLLHSLVETPPTVEALLRWHSPGRSGAAEHTGGIGSHPQASDRARRAPSGRDLSLPSQRRDRVSRREAPRPRKPATPSPSNRIEGLEAETEVTFDEERYLDEYPDVRSEVESGVTPSGLAHFATSGALEGRLPSEQTPTADLQVEFAAFTPSGHVCIVGWMDDQRLRISHLQLRIGFHVVRVPTSRLLRWRRRDVEEKLQKPAGHEYGFLALFHTESPLAPAQSVTTELIGGYASGQSTNSTRALCESELLEHVLTILGKAERTHSQAASFLRDFAGPTAAPLAQLWEDVRTGASRYSVHRIGKPPAAPLLSVATVLYGSNEPVAQQAALVYSHVPPGQVEILYANNAPEHEAEVIREAELLHEVYGHSVTVVSFSGNSGFSNANNVCIELATSDRMLLMNPDVFPLTHGWIEQLATAYAGAPGLMGAVLRYGDGSIMHDGMEIITDRFPPVKADDGASTILRVNHFSKGAPPWSLPEEPYRDVDAVSGAFMFAQRSIFESAGGFSTSYIYGHYEDADFCLRLKQQGKRISVARAPQFYHLEGRGSVWGRHHAGASLYNRCLFTKRWVSRFHGNDPLP